MDQNDHIAKLHEEIEALKNETQNLIGDHNITTAALWLTNLLEYSFQEEVEQQTESLRKSLRKSGARS